MVGTFGKPRHRLGRWRLGGAVAARGHHHQRRVGGGDPWKTLLGGAGQQRPQIWCDFLLQGLVGPRIGANIDLALAVAFAMMEVQTSLDRRGFRLWSSECNA